MNQNSVFLLSLFITIYLEIGMVTSLSCYKYYKTSIKPEDLPKDTPKENCSSNHDACEVRVMIRKASKEILEVNLRCNTLENCQGAGTGCNATVQKSYDYCGHCCQQDNCNTPEIAKFDKSPTNQGQQGHINGLLYVMALAVAVHITIN